MVRFRKSAKHFYEYDPIPMYYKYKLTGKKLMLLREVEWKRLLIVGGEKFQWGLLLDQERSIMKISRS